MGRPRSPVSDQTALRWIAVLMRCGIALSSALLLAGWATGAAGSDAVAAALMVAGCGTVILLPVGGLVLMAGWFARRRAAVYFVLALAVLFLSGASVLVGVVRGMTAHQPIAYGLPASSPT